MGFFSWKTQDTDRSIPSYHSARECFPVIMSDDKGNQYKEPRYEGYGVFGGKDYYVLLAQMNQHLLVEYPTLDRDAGLDLAFRRSESEEIMWPSLSEDGVYRGGEPDRCPDQGFFYDYEEVLP